MRRNLKRVIKSALRVQVIVVEADLLQLDLDESGVASVACGEMAGVHQVFVAYRPNSVCHAYCRLQQDPADGFAEESWSGSALIFCPIENRFFFKKAIFWVISAQTKNRTGFRRAKWSRWTLESCV
jgi:hypothetical protein